MNATIEQRILIVQQLTKCIAAFPTMTWEEKAIIHLYTDNLYTDVNDYMRSGTNKSQYSTHELEIMIERISSGLKGCDQKHLRSAFRGCALSLAEIDAMLNIYENQSTYTFPAFTSATSDYYCAHDYAGNSAYQRDKFAVFMSLDCVSGVDISAISVYPENEILFDKNLTVQITNYEKEKGIHYFDMVEV